MCQLSSKPWSGACLQGVKRQNILIEQEQAEHSRLRKSFNKFFNKSNIDQFVERLSAVIQVWTPRSVAPGSHVPRSLNCSSNANLKLVLHVGRLLLF